MTTSLIPAVTVKLDTTALYAKVAVRTVRAVVSPLDRLALVPRKEASPG